MTPDNDTIILLIEVGTGVMMFLSIAVIATVIILNNKKRKLYEKSKGYMGANSGK